MGRRSASNLTGVPASRSREATYPYKHPKPDQLKPNKEETQGKAWSSTMFAWTPSGQAMG
eukprot:1157652-Pelagomonas_calceolata.AAC.5